MRSKISAEEFKNAVGEKLANEETINWNGLDIVITKTLSLQKVLEFVNNTVSMCFDDDEISFMPEIKDFVIKSNVLELYGNFELPSSAQEAYSLIYNSDIVNVILSYINRQQFSEIVDSIEDKLSYLENEAVQTMNRQANELLRGLENLYEQITEIFSGIDANDMSNLVNMLSMENPDVNKLIDSLSGKSADTEKIVTMPKGGE